MSDASEQLLLVRQLERRSARRGALVAAILLAVLIIAIGAVTDLEMLWLFAFVAIGYVAVSMARPLKLRLDWSDRLGVTFLVLAVLAVAATYIGVQFVARSLEFSAPNTGSGLVAALMVFVAVLPALVRLSSRRVDAGRPAPAHD